MKENDTLSILVAEDNEINQKLISTILTKNGHKYKLADNGTKAVEMYQNDTFDIIFMDCQMPIMDGFSATQKIRNIERESAKKRVPIIAITANAMKGDKERCLQTGMDDFLSKPFRMNELMEIIKKWRCV